MSPTFLIDLPVIMLFGVVFSLFAKKEAGGLFVFFSRYFWHGLVFTSIFNVAVFYAALFYPDWMWMYFVENPSLGAGDLVYIFVFFYYVPYVTGFYLGRDLVLKSIKSWIALVLVLLTAEVWLVAKLFGRYSVVGTRSQYFEGIAVSLFSPDNPVGMVMNITVGAMVLYLLFVVWQYRRRKF